MREINVLLLALMLMLTGCGESSGNVENGSLEQSISTEVSDFQSAESVDIEPEYSQPEYSAEDSIPEADEPEYSESEDSILESDEPEDSESEDSIPESSEPEDSEAEDSNEPAVKHDYQATITSPTCTEAGYTTYTCSICGDSYVSNMVSAKGHSYKEVVTSPTCTEAGYTTYTCSICGDKYVSDEVSAKGHTKKTIAGTAATCTQSGLTDGVQCSVCNDILTEQTEILAFGHDWKAATTSAPKTCLTCGETEGDKLPSTDPVVPDDGGSGNIAYDTLTVNYIDVGQGDSIFIQVGDCDILIDAGKPNKGQTVVNYLNSKGVDDIELMVNTHPDDDHYGGLTTVLNNFDVEQVWGSSFAKSTSSYKSFKSAAQSASVWSTPSVGNVFSYEYLTLTVLYAGEGASNSNDSSLVLALQYGNFRFLFTGDISSTIENKLVNSNISLRCDVLKVAHHGSAKSSASAFLQATGAKYGVICVGDNSYGHPTSTALNNLKNTGISVYRTDTDGTVVFSTDGNTLQLPGSGGTVSGGSASSSGSSSSSTDTFIGNKESKIFHLPTCGNLPAVSKRNYLYDYWFIVNCIGYKPCQVCLKNYTP